ncbi:MAG: hypothetical protein WAQ98_11230 [Blastocatellia bacterium]
MEKLATLPVNKPLFSFEAFLDEYETIILYAATETLKDFLPDYERPFQTGQVGEYAGIMASVFEYALVNFSVVEKLTGMQKKQGLNLYVIAATIYITLNLLGSNARKVCSHWQPSELVNPIILEDQDRVLFFFHRHMATCEPCRACYFIVLKVNSESGTRNFGDSPKVKLVIHNAFWRNTREQLIEAFLNRDAAPDKMRSSALLDADRGRFYTKFFACLSVFLLFSALFSVGYLFRTAKTEKIETLPINLNIPKEANLYAKLDDSIYSYLVLDNDSDIQITKAKELSRQIKAIYKDKYGIDLIDYYTNTKTSRDQILSLKRRFKRLSSFTFQNDPDVFLAELQTLEKDFLLSGNPIEAYMVKSMMAMFYTLNYNPAASDALINDGLAFALEKDYRFLELQFLFVQSKNLIDSDRYFAKLQLANVIERAKTLQINDIVVSCSMSLAGIYEIENENEKALSLINDLNLLHLVKHTTQVSCYQIAAVASHKLGKIKLSDEYFKKALDIAESKQDTFLHALTYTLKGNIAAEQGLFNESEGLFNRAENLAGYISSEVRKVDLMSRILGYKAKAKMLKGDYVASFGLYKETLEYLDKLHMDRSLERGQINDALASLASRLGNDSHDYKIAARVYRKEAKMKYQQISCILSFMPKECS